MSQRIPHDLGRAIVALRVRARVTAYIVPPLVPLGIAKKEIMQMREAAVSRRVPRSRRCAPLNAGPFAVSCNVRIPKGFPATCVRSLPLPARKRDFRARSARRPERLWSARTRHAYRNYVGGGAKRIFITRPCGPSSSEDFPSTRLPLLKHSYGWKF